MKPAETTDPHSRIMKCALELEEARAYWQHTDGSVEVTPQQAFDEFWFGARSLARVKVLLLNFRARFDAFPPSLSVLHRWPDMSPDTRRLIGHWHLQLADPLYRSFTGDYLVERRDRGRPEVTRDLVTAWVGEEGPERWTMSTRIQFASKLLSAAHAAGLVSKTRDPRPLTYPRVTDEALEYLVYLLRGVAIADSIVDNPYLRSVGLDATFAEQRLGALPSLRFQRQGDLVDFGWRYPSLGAWADARLSPPAHAVAGAVP